MTSVFFLDKGFFRLSGDSLNSNVYKDFTTQTVTMDWEDTCCFNHVNVTVTTHCSDVTEQCLTDV